MGKRLDGRDDRKVHSIPSMIGEGAYASFAENHIVIAFSHYVLGCQQQFVERGRHTPLEHYRLASLAYPLEEREVLHVAGADLHDISIFFHQVYTLVVQDFCHDLHPEPRPHLVEYFKSFKSESLETVGRRSGLECAPAKKLDSAGIHQLCYFHCLVARFNSAGTGNDCQVWTADSGVADFYHAVFVFEVTADQLKRFGNADRFCYAGKVVEVPGIYRARVSGYADRGAVCAGHRMRLQSEGGDGIEDRFDLVFGCVGMHDD